jgi:hypothetical protein
MTAAQGRLPAPCSPRRRPFYAWLLALALVLGAASAAPKVTLQGDVDALLALRRAITNLNSTVVSTWNLTTDPCVGGWAGVACNCSQIATDQVPGCSKDYANSSNFRVLKLDLGPVTRSSGGSPNSGKIQGAIPPELGSLSDMLFLDLSQNQLT